MPFFVVQRKYKRSKQAAHCVTILPFMTKFNLQPKKLAYFKFFWRKAYLKFLGFKSKIRIPSNSLEGALNSSLFERPHMTMLRMLKPILCE